MAIVYESMKLTDGQKTQSIHQKRIFAIVHCSEMWQHKLGLHKTKVYTDNVSLEIFWDTCGSKRQPIAVAQYIGAYKGGFDLQSGSSQYGVERAK
jgi:hypothetical protein